jgi:tetratricopeptide (TPR) repeat protein
LGLGGTFLTRKEKRFDFQKSAGMNLGFSLVFSVLLIGTVSFLYFGVRIWLGDFYLAKAQKSIKQGADYSQTVEYLRKGAINSPWLASPHLVLADGLLVQAGDALDQNNTVQARSLLQASEAEAEEAIAREPKNVVSYERAGEIYQLINSVGGLEENTKIIEVYEQALELDSNNALLNLTLGTLYLAKAQEIQNTISSSEESSALEGNYQNYLQKAEEKIKRANELRTGYRDAQVLYAQVLEFQGRRSQAIAHLNEALEGNPTDLALLEESGKLLLANDELAAAEERFQTILTFSPFSANARYWLATIYEKQGKIEEAIAELETVLLTNPGNTLVTEKLSELKGE